MLVTDEKLKDLGSIKFGQVYKFNYKLVNAGDNDVTINKLQVSCSSCTSATSSKKLVRPGEEVIVNVTFTPGTVSKQRKHIDVLCSDGHGVRLEFIGDSHG